MNLTGKWVRVFYGWRYHMYGELGPICGAVIFTGRACMWAPTSQEVADGAVPSTACPKCKRKVGA